MPFLYCSATARKTISAHSHPDLTWFSSHSQTGPAPPAPLQPACPSSDSGAAPCAAGTRPLAGLDGFSCPYSSGKSSLNYLYRMNRHSIKWGSAPLHENQQMTPDLFEGICSQMPLPLCDAQKLDIQTHTNYTV